MVFALFCIAYPPRLRAPRATPMTAKNKPAPSGKTAAAKERPWDQADQAAPKPTRDADIVLQRLRDIDPNFSAPPLNRFAALVVKGKAATDGLCKELAHPDPAVRVDAAQALGLLGDTRALRPLKERLGDPEQQVRLAAALALIKVGEETLFPEIVKGLRAGDPNVVIGAALALGRLADRRVVPNLVEAFKTKDPRIGSAVAWALGQCGDVACLPWLTTAVQQNFAAAAACEALGRLGDARAQPALLQALDSKDDDTRAYGARALGMLKGGSGPSAVGARATTLAEGKAVPALKKLLTDSSKKVRLCASIALYELGEKSGGRHLVRELAE
jgi:HEAT repeat protein